MPRSRAALLIALLFSIVSVGPGNVRAQEAEGTVAERLGGLRYRSVGPYRGGRVTAVDGVPGRPFEFLFGGTGGGVWATRNAGHTWDNVSDGFFDVGPVGAVEVADADPNVIYVGTGSACIRGNISVGRGMYRSTDGGATWDSIGLRDAGQIGRVLTHPGDENLVYAAVLGNPFGASEERGVYRSADGGATWDRVLYVSDEVGAVDLAMNPANPRILFAAMWRGERKPWTLISGSEDGGLFRSADGGDTWQRVEGGFPQGLVGRIGVAISPADPDRVWALVEADDDRTALYRSDDGGTSWRRSSSQGGLTSRPWYYMHVEPHPTDRNTVFVLNSGFFKSIDGGETFDRVAMPHSDHHDLWIDPGNPEVMLMGNDGGATVSFDAGETWSVQFNQPTAGRLDGDCSRRCAHLRYRRHGRIDPLAARTRFGELLSPHRESGTARRRTVAPDGARRPCGGHSHRRGGGQRHCLADQFPQEQLRHAGPGRWHRLWLQRDAVGRRGCLDGRDGMALAPAG